MQKKTIGPYKVRGWDFGKNNEKNQLLNLTILANVLLLKHKNIYVNFFTLTFFEMCVDIL